MSRSRILIMLTLAVLTALAFGVLVGCESKPAAPAFRNPFDPGGSSGGDPLNLTATVSGNSIVVMWDQPQGLDIDHYDISHSFDSVLDYEYLATVDQTSSSTNQFIYDDPSPTRIHYFKVQAFNTAGDFTIIIDQTPALVSTGPTMAVEGDPVGKKIASRHVHLTVTVTGLDSILIAETADFSAGVSFPVAQSGVGQDITWDLPQAEQGDTLTLYAKGVSGAYSSTMTVRPLIVTFAPTFNITDKPATVPSRLVTLDITNAGVDSMRFATDQDALATTVWLPADSTLSDFTLGDSVSPQTIYGEFQGDFGFNTTATWEVTPDLLQDAAFHLDLPEGNITSSTTVTGISNANATLMRFSTRPDFLDAPWQAYADTTTLTLAEVEGQQTIYAQYRNDWTDSGILTDTVIHVLQPVTIGFAAPLDGQVLLGGLGLQVQGYAMGATQKAAVDSVGLDLGDGTGFHRATGTVNWTYLWDVPSFDGDTPLTLRARAWSAEESATATIGVTVTQLVLVVQAPLAGAELTADEDITISGTAQGLLNGPAIDQISVVIDDQTIVATGTDTWSATWHTPVVTEPTATTITVTLHAGSDSLTREVAVTVVPPVAP